VEAPTRNRAPGGHGQTGAPPALGGVHL